jgi:hypothetical protein
VNILDEDIDIIQRKLLLARKVHFRQIGHEIGRFGMKDRDDVVPLLHSLRNPTFFTRDHGYYSINLRHAGYCLVHLDVRYNEVAEYIPRFLRHKAFRAQAQRMGKVVRVRHTGLSYWQVGLDHEIATSWESR